LFDLLATLNSILHRSNDFYIPVAAVCLPVDSAKDLTQWLVYKVEKRKPHDVENRERQAIDPPTDEISHWFVLLGQGF